MEVIDPQHRPTSRFLTRSQPPPSPAPISLPRSGSVQPSAAANGSGCHADCSAAFARAAIAPRGTVAQLEVVRRLRHAFFILDQPHSESDGSRMPTSVERITHEALTLPETDRAHLAHTLLQSLEPAEESVEEAWASEVGRRVKRVHEGTAQGRPADEVFRDIRARLQQ